MKAKAARAVATPTRAAVWTAVAAVWQSVKKASTLVLLWAAQCPFDLLEDGAGGLGELVGVGLAEMVVRGDHPCQPSEGGDEDVESVLLGVFFGFDEELDALFEEGDRVGEVEGVEAEGDLVLDAAGGR